MSGEQILPLRLPPSGALVQDALSSQALVDGHGTPGLVWRGQYSGAGTDIGAQYATPVAIAGLGGAWDLAGAYWYDLEFSLSIQAGAGATVNNLIVLAQGSHDNGATWTELMSVMPVNATALGANESATYASGALRFYPGTDVTNIRIVAGANGNAGDRVVIGGWLRVEQYTEGDEPKVVRLNPSGSFLEDATSNVPAQIGSGSPGQVWRAVATAPTAIGGSAPQVVTGLSKAWALPAGYRYDFEFSGELADGAAGTQANLVVNLEVSINNGGTWTTIRSTTVPGANLAAAEGRTYFAGLFNYIPSVDITNVRVTAAGWAAARILALAWLKVEQYVT